MVLEVQVPPIPQSAVGPGEASFPLLLKPRLEAELPGCILRGNCPKQQARASLSLRCEHPVELAELTSCGELCTAPTCSKQCRKIIWLER